MINEYKSGEELMDGSLNFNNRKDAIACIAVAVEHMFRGGSKAQLVVCVINKKVNVMLEEDDY